MCLTIGLAFNYRSQYDMKRNVILTSDQNSKAYTSDINLHVGNVKFTQ